MVSLARVLLDSGLIDVAWLGKATAIANEANVPICHALTRWKLLEPKALANAISKATGLVVVDVDHVAGGAAALMQRQACHRLRVLPIKVEAGVLTLGMTDPTDDDAAGQVESALHLSVQRVLVDDDALERALRRVFAKPGDELAASAAAPTKAARSAPWSPLVTKTEESSSSERPDSRKIIVGEQQEMAVVLAEPTLKESQRIAEIGGPELFLFTPTGTPTPPQASFNNPPTLPLPRTSSSSSFPASFEPASSGVFSSNTIEMRSPAMPVEATVQMALPKLAETVRAGSPVVTDEAPTLQNDLVGTMRVLIAVDDKAASDGLVASFGLRLRELAVVSFEKAVDEVSRRRFDVVVIVEPKNTIQASQQVAAVAARAKAGVVVVSTVADFARLPGVFGIVDPPKRPGDLITTIEKILADRARG